MADEYRIDLEERTDRYKKTYLFGSLRMFNSVMFIRKDKDGHWHAAIKPYTGKGNDKGNGRSVDKEDAAEEYPWSEDDKR